MVRLIACCLALWVGFLTGSAFADDGAAQKAIAVLQQQRNEAMDMAANAHTEIALLRDKLRAEAEAMEARISTLMEWLKAAQAKK